MCTISVVPDRDGFRLISNRDEHRTRPDALPPAWRPLRHRTAIYPVDPIGPGTWIGVNDAGLAATLLNHTPMAGLRRSGGGRHSRGLIVPRLLAERTTSGAIAAARQLDLQAFNLFRVLLIADDEDAVVLTSDGTALSCERVSLARPLMMTSSSLGDAVVDPPRRQLFEAMLGSERSEWLRGQDRFHAHQWPIRPAISVVMVRADARTVSRTSISVSSDGIRLRYTALADSAQRARAAA
jgi:hypothetical protein